jgi:diguanylate cyclase (GGDEF)-like protein/PAS domain S-box-containing protein
MEPHRDTSSLLPDTVVDVLESMTDVFVALDRDWRFAYANRRAVEIYGRTPEELIGKHIWTEYPEAVGGPFQLACEKAMRERTVVLHEDHYEPLGRWYENRIFPSAAGVSIFAQDITARKLAETQVRRSEHRYRVLVHGLSDYVWTADREGKAVEAASWHALTGRGEPDGSDPDWLGALHPEDRGRVRDEWLAALRSGAGFVSTARVRRADGEWRYVRARAVPVLEDGEVREWMGVMFDETDQVLAEDVLRRSALEDPLTGLPNRTVFLDRLRGLIAHRRPSLAAVLYVDVDRFKAINDSFGHAAGDMLLGCIATRLARAARPSDVVSRLSGDEFAVLCDELHDHSEAVAIACRLCAEIARPLPEDDRIQVTASIGLAFVGHEDDPEAALRASDAAMYRAKSYGGGKVEVFDEALRARLQTRLSIEHDLRSGLRDGRMNLHYQPIVSLHAGRQASAEALLRWTRPDGAVLSAAEVVSVAEQAGLIGSMGAAVLKSACRQAAAWRDDGIPVKVAVNISARQLARGDELVAQVQGALAEWQLAPELLVLEITETVLMQDIGKAEEVLRTLRSLGVALEIDDFGVGYSSLSRLHRLSVDAVKIDQSFTSGLPHDATSARVVEAIVGLARAFKLNVVAEGVERDDQLRAMRELGCDSVQGFGLAQPAPAAELAAAITRANATVAAMS